MRGAFGATGDREMGEMRPKAHLSGDVAACIVCRMLIRSSALAFLILLSAPATFAEVLQLKDKAAIAGKILAEKRDQVIVDLGYTVLAVPRNQIIRILRDDEMAAETKTAKTKETQKSSKPNPAAVPKKIEPLAATSGRQGLYSV